MTLIFFFGPRKEVSSVTLPINYMKGTRDNTQMNNVCISVCCGSMCSVVVCMYSILSFKTNFFPILNFVSYFCRLEVFFLIIPVLHLEIYSLYIRSNKRWRRNDEVTKSLPQKHPNSEQAPIITQVQCYGGTNTPPVARSRFCVVTFTTWLSEESDN